MKISQRGINLISEFEGWRSTPYQDIAGYWTIGFGHKILPGEKFTVLSLEESRKLLRADAQDAEDAVNALVSVSMTQPQFDALASFVFNVGRTAFLGSSMLRHMNNNRPLYAFREFSRWIHAGGKPSLGLARRRAAEGSMFLEE